MTQMELVTDPTRVAFLSELSERHQALIVWKHLDRALLGRGDIDAAAPTDAVVSIMADAVSIASATLGASHAIACPHVADKQLQFFVQPERLPQLFEFDVCTQPSRGLSPWAAPHSLIPLSILRPNGIRSLRPGAEALVSLVYHGLSCSGEDRLAGDERLIVNQGLGTDIDATFDAVGVMPPPAARYPLRALVCGLRNGVWDRRSARQAYLAFAASAFGHPRFLARRVRFRADLAAGHECVMSRLARREDRRVSASGLGNLLARAEAEGHRVVEL